MRNLSLKLPDALDANLRALARRKRMSKSAVVKEALEAYFAGTNGTREPSCFDLAPDLWGSVEGPGDLSYNKKHMDG